MILVTRINKANQFYMNEDLIEFIEEAPDTIVTLTTGKKVAVAEGAIELIERIREEKIRVIRATQFTE
jgi:flagellar protein FlbD